MRQHQRNIMRRNIKIRIRQHDKDGSINKRVQFEIQVPLRLDGRRGMSSVSGIDDVIQRCVGNIQLRDPRREGRRASGGVRNVGVIRADVFSGVFEDEVYLASGIGELCAIVRDRRRVGVGIRSVGVVGDDQSWEVLPRKPGRVRGTRLDVWCEQGPGEGLGNADFEPFRHWEEALELAGVSE